MPHLGELGVAELRAHLAELTDRLSPGQALQALLDAGQDRLPLPAQGDTLRRWQLLAEVAAHDLSLAKLFESHVDALAILTELQVQPVLAATAERLGAWGVWCAEPPDARLRCSAPDAEGRVVIDGRKAWCSGAAVVGQALVSAWNGAGEPCLLAVSLSASGVTITDQGWQAVGMGATASVDVLFDGVRGLQVGPPGAYLARPGFWQGGAGIAACWFGASGALGETLRRACRTPSGTPDPHRLAHLGHVDTVLAATRALLRQSAEWIDAHPGDDARQVALRARLAAEACAQEVVSHVSRALGAAPLCRDARVARLVADLPVFIRQSHAERDLAALGLDIVNDENTPWAL